MSALVALVGRPNVGKSTLFNRLVGRRQALVEDVPGVTRDRHYGEVTSGDVPFTLVDTGGFVPSDSDPLLSKVRDQAALAVESCDLICLLVDGRAGLTAADEAVAKLLRKSGKPLLLAVNKMDSSRRAEVEVADFFRLGIDPTLPLSAEHALGIDALLEAIARRLPAAEVPPDAPSAERDENAPVRLAIIGRPNVGKSTLVNALLREERMVASPVPGTTRDSVDSVLDFRGRPFVITDTAGLRRKRSISQSVEKFAVMAALRSLGRSEVAALVLDATEPAVDQDAKLAGMALEGGRALLLVVNKWDQVPKEKRREDLFRAELKWALKFAAFVPAVFTSALEGRRVERVLEVAGQLGDQHRFRASTPKLNQWMERVVDAHPPPLHGGKPARLYYVAQVASAPPTFAIHCNRPERVAESYKRYLVNQLRETFDLRVPVRLLFRGRADERGSAARKRPRSRD